MANESSYESDISESWSLVDINLNEGGITALEAYSIDKRDKNFSSEAESDEPGKSTKYDFKKVCSNQAKLEYDENENVEPEKLELSFQDIKLNFSSYEKQDWKEESSDEAKNDSCDGESIEILDMDGNYVCEDPDNDRIAFTIIGDDATNDKNYYYDKNFENSIQTILHKRKRRRRKSSSISESSSNSNSDILYCDEINSNLNLNVNRKMEEVKKNKKPIYKHCRNNFTNTALSLSLGVIFAGVACIAIGHFLGVHDAGKTADELMNNLKKLQSENFALQSRLSELDKGFTSKNLDVEMMRQLNEIKNVRDSLQEIERRQFTEGNRESDENSVLNDRGTLNSLEWFVKFQNLMKRKEFIQNRHFNDLKKVVLHVHDQLSFLNSKKKNSIKLKNLEEKYYKISKVSQKILRKLASSHENLESSYHKLIDLRDNLNKKLSKMFSEVSEKFCTIEQRNLKICDEKKSVVEKIICGLLKCGPENENIIDATKNSLPVTMFPQPEEYYLSTENSSTSNTVAEKINLNKSSIVTNINETSNKKTEKMDQLMKAHATITVINKNSERKKGDSSGLLKNKTDKKEGKNKQEKKIRKNKEKQINVFLNNENDRLRRSMKSKKSNEKSGEFDPKQKNNFYKNYNIKNNEGGYRKTKDLKEKILEKDIKFKSKFLKKKSKGSKFRRIFKLKIIKENFYESVTNRTGFSLNPNFLSGNHSNFNATGNWFFKWATGREQSRYHQGLGDWQFDRARGRKVLRNEELDINWHLKRALARQSNRNKNELHGESYERKNYGDKGFYHEEFSWI